MIKIFRNIRRKLLYKGDPNRPKSPIGRYLIYGLGEIFLVVIGILIALQINNLNEQRKQKNLEQDYLSALKREFENNLDEVDRVINLNDRLLENALELSTFTGPIVANISEKRFAELYIGTINSEVQYRPGSGVTNEILSSGKLNIFQNNELKNALATMDGLLLRIRYQENEELTTNRMELINLASEKGSMRKMAFDAYGENFGLNEGKFLDSNLHLLSLKKFDSRLTGFIYTSGFLKRRYETLKKQIAHIIQIIDSQIK